MARSRRGHRARGRCGGATGPGSPANKVWPGRWRGHQRDKGSPPDNEAAVGAHLRVMLTVREGRRQWLEGVLRRRGNSGGWQ
jgi:hypothetical protein